MENAVQIIPAYKAETAKEKVAAYCRVSSDSTDQLNSYQAQLDAYTSLINSNPKWELADIYADEGLTGTKRESRAEFNRMMEDARRGKINRILVKSVSRFARNTKDSLEAIRELSSLGIAVIFEEQSLDTSTMGGELLVATLSSIAQEESISISNNVRWSYQKRMQNGTNKPTKAPLGYDLINGKLVINEAEEKIVKGIYADYLSGKGTLEISNALNEQKIKQKNNGKRWTSRNVIIILTNEKYAGDMLHQKTYTTPFPFTTKRNDGEQPKYYQSNTHEGIISREIFEKVKQLLQKRQEKYNYNYSPNKPGALTKLMKCSLCTSSLKRVVKHGTLYRVCADHNRGKKICPLPHILETEIEAVLLKIINTLKEKRKYILYPLIDQTERLKDNESKNNLALTGIKQQILDLNEQNHALERLRTKSLIDSAFYIQQTNEIETKIKALKREERNIAQENDKDLIIKATKAMIAALESFDGIIESVTDELLKALVRQIKAMPEDSLEITLVNGMKLTEKYYRKERR